MKELAARGVKVVGISGDSVKNHRIFKRALDLNFTLLSDKKGEVARRFGVPVKKGGTLERVVSGEKIEFTRAVTFPRWTFVIDRRGRIADVARSVAPSADSKRVLKVIDKMLEGLAIGDPAPKFRARADSGKTWKSWDTVGKGILVLYFYPADMTRDCTVQACGFRDQLTKLRTLGAEVVGVSGDSVENHRVFKKAYDLNFTLLADESGALANIFGVPLTGGGTVKKTIDGRPVTLERRVTAARRTFVIGRDGKVAYTDRRVRAAKDSEKILKVVQAPLAKGSPEGIR